MNGPLPLDNEANQTEIRGLRNVMHGCSHLGRAGHDVQTSASSTLKIGGDLHVKSDDGGRFAITFPKSKP